MTGKGKKTEELNYTGASPAAAPQLLRGEAVGAGSLAWKASDMPPPPSFLTPSKKDS